MLFVFILDATLFSEEQYFLGLVLYWYGDFEEKRLFFNFRLILILHSFSEGKYDGFISKLFLFFLLNGFLLLLSFLKELLLFGRLLESDFLLKTFFFSKF